MKSDGFKGIRRYVCLVFLISLFAFWVGCVIHFYIIRSNSDKVRIDTIYEPREVVNNDPLFFDKNHKSVYYESFALVMDDKGDIFDVSVIRPQKSLMPKVGDTLFLQRKGYVAQYAHERSEERGCTSSSYLVVMFLLILLFFVAYIKIFGLFGKNFDRIR